MVDECIWGHRIYDEQAGPMVLLELLNVMASKSLIDFSPNEELRYQLERKLPLRSYIFKNPFIELSFEGSYDPWEDWYAKFMNKDMSKLFEQFANPTSDNRGVDTLREIFDGDREESYKNFADLVKLVKDSAINVDSNKRWTSKFVFPWGRDCLFTDMRETDGSNDRRFFARTGELVFILLSRSRNKGRLKELIDSNYLTEVHPLNRVCKLFQKGYGQSSVEVSGARPPVEVLYQSEEDFGDVRKISEEMDRRSNLLCNDMIAVLECSLSAEDKFYHLSRLINLHVVCYLIERSQVALNQSERRIFLCEIITKKSGPLRKASQRLFLGNRQVTRAAVQHYIDVKCKEIHASCADSKENYDEAFRGRFLSEFRISSNSEFSGTPEALCRKLREKALERHERHLGNVHNEFAKAIGLASKCGSRAYRYTVDDPLIMSLVLANIHGRRLNLNSFLEVLFAKYNIVIGEKGKDYVNEHYLDDGRLDSSDMTENVENFKARLKSLGILSSLSDGCDFVLNPFANTK